MSDTSSFAVAILEGVTSVVPGASAAPVETWIPEAPDIWSFTPFPGLLGLTLAYTGFLFNTMQFFQTGFQLPSGANTMLGFLVWPPMIWCSLRYRSRVSKPIRAIADGAPPTQTRQGGIMVNIKTTTGHVDHAQQGRGKLNDGSGNWNRRPSI